MKKHALLIALALLAFACQKRAPVVPEISLNTPAAVTVDTEGAIETVSFNASVAWTASIDNSSWTLSARSGDAGDASIKVTAPQNNTDDNIVAVLTIRADKASKTVTFTQLQKDGFAFVDGDEMEIDCNAQTIEVKVLANVDYSVKCDADWISVASRASVESTNRFDVQLNKGDAAREGTITFTAEGKGGTHVFTVRQSAFQPVFEADVTEHRLGTEGGSVSFTVNANVEYEVNDPGYDWMSLTNDGDVYTITVAPNQGYDLKYGYFRVSTPEVQIMEDLDWDGIPETEVDLYFNVTVHQAGHSSVSWTKSLTGYSGMGTVGGIHRLGLSDGRLVVSDGTDIHVIDVSNGDYIAKFDLPAGAVPESMATDAAGNVLVAAIAPFGGTFEVYAAGPADGYSGVARLISYEHADIWSNRLANVRVCGDIGSSAVVCAYTDLSAYCVYWQIEGGVASDASFFALPAGNTVWNSARNGCVTPAGPVVSDGFYYAAYDGIYALYHCTVSGDNTTLFEGLSSSNENVGAVSAAEWDGRKYVAAEKGRFFSWGACPDFVMIDATDLSAPAVVSNFNHRLESVPITYLGSNDGENASGDILLIPGADRLDVVVVDCLADVLYCVTYPKL